MFTFCVLLDILQHDGENSMQLSLPIICWHFKENQSLTSNREQSQGKTRLQWAETLSRTKLIPSIVFIIYSTYILAIIKIRNHVKI